MKARLKRNVFFLFCPSYNIVPAYPMATDHTQWVSLVSSLCAERRATGGRCHDEWVSRSEEKLREANAAAQVPAAALWLAARCWALAARAEAHGAAPSSEPGHQTAVHRLALADDLCLPGSVCAELLGNGGKGRAKATASDGWLEEFAVFRALFIEVALSPSAHHSLPLSPLTPGLRGGRCGQTLQMGHTLLRLACAVFVLPAVM
jgi:hypothetical protein